MTPLELKIIRTQKLHLTQPQLAEQLDLSSTTISHWEGGKSPIPYSVDLALMWLMRERVTNADKIREGAEAGQVREATVELAARMKESAASIYGTGFTLCIREFYSFVMEHGNSKEAVDSEIALQLRVSVDTLRRWLRAEEGKPGTTPNSPTKTMEVMWRMIVVCERIRGRMTKLGESAMRRLEEVRGLLEVVDQREGRPSIIEECSIDPTFDREGINMIRRMLDE